MRSVPGNGGRAPCLQADVWLRCLVASPVLLCLVLCLCCSLPRLCRVRRVVSLGVLAEAEAKLCLAQAEKALAGATRKRRRTDERADVKAFAVKVLDESGDARAAAVRTKEHFEKQHRNVEPSASHVRRWAAALGADADRFARTSRGGRAKLPCRWRSSVLSMRGTTCGGQRRVLLSVLRFFVRVWLLRRRPGRLHFVEGTGFSVGAEAACRPSRGSRGARTQSSLERSD